MPFQKGRSGNPGGRPKKTEQLVEIEQLARQYAPQAMEALVKIAMSGKTDSARVAASIAILDRAFGRPRQTLEAKNASNVQYFI
jgi:phage gp46-like protein